MGPTGVQSGIPVELVSVWARNNRPCYSGCRRSCIPSVEVCILGHRYCDCSRAHHAQRSLSERRTCRQPTRNVGRTVVRRSLRTQAFCVTHQVRDWQHCPEQRCLLWHNVPLHASTHHRRQVALPDDMPHGTAHPVVLGHLPCLH